MASKYEALKQRMASWREKGQEQLGHVLQTAEIGDQDGNRDVMGMPASLAAAVVGHGLGFMGVFGKHSEHAHNLADGALAEYAVVQGMRLGASKSSEFSGQRRIAGRRSVAGLPGNQNPFAQRNNMGNFTRAANPFVRAA
jgi:hypothetical protein